MDAAGQVSRLEPARASEIACGYGEDAGGAAAQVVAAAGLASQGNEAGIYGELKGDVIETAGAEEAEGGGGLDEDGGKGVDAASVAGDLIGGLGTA